MALIKFGGGVVQMAGSIAGTTFARNRYGNYARARTKPVNPNTDRQQEVRSAVAFLADRWSQTLDAAQRTAWNLYASNVTMKNRLGESIQLSGFNHYIRSNTPLKQVGQAIHDDGPTVFELPAKDPTFGFTATEDPNQITYTWDSLLNWCAEDGAMILVYEGQPQNPQRNFFGGPWRFLGRTKGVDPGPAVPPSVQPSKFGIAELQRIWCYARISRADGRLSEPFRADAFCTA